MQSLVTMWGLKLFSNKHTLQPITILIPNPLRKYKNNRQGSMNFSAKNQYISVDIRIKSTKKSRNEKKREDDNINNSYPKNSNSLLPVSNKISKNKSNYWLIMPNSHRKQGGRKLQPMYPSNKENIKEQRILVE